MRMRHLTDLSRPVTRPFLFVIPPSNGTPHTAISRPLGSRVWGKRKKVTTPAKRGIASRLEGPDSVGGGSFIVSVPSRFPASVNACVPEPMTSGVIQEWIDNTRPVENLPVLEVLGQKHGSAGVDRGFNNQSVPVRKLRRCAAAHGGLDKRGVNRTDSENAKIVHRPAGHVRLERRAVQWRDDEQDRCTSRAATSP